MAHEIPPEALAQMEGMMAAHSDLQIPPPVFEEMGGEFVEMDLEKKEVVVRFPILKKFENPMGYMQGGMIAAAVDNAIGPLSFMVAPPSVTKTLTMEYLRPIASHYEQVLVRATCTSVGEREATFTAVVSTEQGTTLARAEAHHVIMKRRNK